jgi:hypothetical protein
MPGASLLIGVNGAEVWAYVVELQGGLRVRLLIDDWERLGLFRGQRIQIRLPEKADQWLYLAEVTETPPVVWVVMVERVRGVG